VIDRLCERSGTEAVTRKFEATLALVGAGAGRVCLAKPQTYMNLSGRTVRALTSYYRVEPEEGILVVCDDMALPLGALRLRGRGRSGGQKGLGSIIEALGTEHFARLRVGVGEPPGEMEATDYVLGRFADGEAEAIEAAIDRAADCVEVWLQEGVQAAMNRFNLRKLRKQPGSPEDDAGPEQLEERPSRDPASSEACSDAPGGGRV
jgi:PTH1 family peptidyl-tRNA hydrolase